MRVHVSELPVMNFQLMEPIIWAMHIEYTVTKFRSPKSVSSPRPLKRQHNNGVRFLPARMQSQNWCCRYGFSIGIGKISIIVMGN